MGLTSRNWPSAPSADHARPSRALSVAGRPSSESNRPGSGRYSQRRTNHPPTSHPGPGTLASIGYIRAAATEDQPRTARPAAPRTAPEASSATTAGVRSRQPARAAASRTAPAAGSATTAAPRSQPMRPRQPAPRRPRNPSNHPPPSAAWSRSCSRTSSASRPSPRTEIPRRSASSSPVTSMPPPR